MADKMRILKFLGKGKVGYYEAGKPIVSKDAVVVRIRASAICGSEKASFFATSFDDDTFFNSGHEFVGTIEETPPNCSLKPGMRVGACVVQGCGDCDFCREGYETACQNKSYYSGNGHAEYKLLGINGVRQIPDDVDWPEAAILTGDGLGVPVRCARRLGDTAGKNIVVLGLGPVGLSCVLVQTFKGANVMGADICDYRVKLARDIGADNSVNIANDDLKSAVTDWTNGKGADIVILAVGRSDSLNQAIDIVCQQGTVFQVAEFSQATIDPSGAFIRKEITMTGSWYYTSADWEEMLTIQKQGLPIKKLITHTYPFEKAQEAYQTFFSGNAGKVVLTYDK